MDSTPPSGTTVLASPNVPGPTVRAGVGNAYQGIRIKGKAKVHQGDTGDTITNNTTNIYFKRDDTTRLADIIDITKNLVSSDKTVTELLSSDDISTASHHNARNKPKKMGYGSRALQRWLNDSTQGRSTQVPTQEHASQPERSAERAPGFQEALMHSEPLDIMQDLIAPETEPAPSYALCLGGPAEAKIALAQTMKEDDHLGLFWEVRQPLHALYGTGDPRLRPKKRKITILLLSVDGNVECWTMLDTWRGRLQKLHPNMKHIVSSPKGKTLMLNNICVLDKHQKSFCGVQLTFKVIDSKRHFKDIPQSADDGDIFSVLCFNILDHRNFDKTVEMWTDMRGYGTRMSPDIFLGTTPLSGNVRQFTNMTPPKRRDVHISTTSRESGQKAANGFGEQEANEKNAEHVGTRVYAECAWGNASARDALFPTLIGCATAYSCFGS